MWDYRRYNLRPCCSFCYDLLVPVYLHTAQPRHRPQLNWAVVISRWWIPTNVNIGQNRDKWCIEWLYKWISEPVRFLLECRMPQLWPHLFLLDGFEFCLLMFVLLLLLSQHRWQWLDIMFRLLQVILINLYDLQSFVLFVVNNWVVILDTAEVILEFIHTLL